MNTNKNTYRFHNPNNSSATADYILPFFIDANMQKLIYISEPSEALNKI